MRLGFNPKMFVLLIDVPSEVISFLKMKTKINDSEYELMNTIHANHIHSRFKKKNLE